MSKFILVYLCCCCCCCCCLSQEWQEKRDFQEYEVHLQCRNKDRQRDTQLSKHAVRWTEIQTGRWTDRQAGRGTERQTTKRKQVGNWQTDRQRQTDRCSETDHYQEQIPNIVLNSYATVQFQTISLWVILNKLHRKKVVGMWSVSGQWLGGW